MNKTLGISALLSVLVGITAFGAAIRAPSSNLPATQTKFVDTGITDGQHGNLMAGPAYGDFQHGAHGTFVRMPAGFVSPVHIHTADYYAVVIAGVAANGLPGAPDVALPAGSYWLQKGGEAHVTKCLAGSECLFFINQPDKFDYVVQAKR